MGSEEKLSLKRTSSRTEKQEEKAQAPEEAAQLPEKAAQDAQEEAGEPAPAPSTEAENECGSPMEERPATERRAESAALKDEKAGGDAEPTQESRGAEQPEEGAVGQQSSQSPPGGVEGGPVPEEGERKGKQQEGTVPEPGCHPRTGSEVPETQVGDPGPSPGEQVQGQRACPCPVPHSPSQVSSVHSHKGAGLRQAAANGGWTRKGSCLMLSRASR